jgi:hypothetical protein
MVPGGQFAGPSGPRQDCSLPSRSGPRRGELTALEHLAAVFVPAPTRSSSSHAKVAEDVAASPTPTAWAGWPTPRPATHG